MTVRTVPAPLQTHVDGAVTQITTLMRVTWETGEIFHFTDHDVDVPFGGDTYRAALGYSRTDIANSTNLTVDSLDASGLLDAREINEADMRAGCWDHSKVRIIEVNWGDPDGDGSVTVRLGWFGEVIFDEQSQTFSVELRGLTQAFSQNIIEKTSPGCRYDVGDARCNRDDIVPINPPDIADSTAYAVGDVVKVRQPVDDVAVLHAPGVIDADDDSQFAATGTLGSDATAADTNKLKNLAGNFRFQPVGGPTQNPSNSFVSWPDASQYAIGLEPFDIEFWFNADAIFTGDVGPVLASHYDAPTQQRSWIVYIGSSTEPNPGLQFVQYNGTAAVINRLIIPPVEFTPRINQFYHLRITRDHKYQLRIFIDGFLRALAFFPFDFFDSTAPIRLGMFNSTAGGNRHFEGTIEDFRIVVGDPVSTKEFTPPTAPLASTFTDTLTFQEDYQDTNYRVITAGTTGASNVANFPTILDTVATGPIQIDVTAANELTRLSGSFIDDGWETDMVYRGSGFTDPANNIIASRILTVTALVITTTSSPLVVETGTGDEVIAHVAWDNGVEFAPEDALHVAGVVLEVISPSKIKVGAPSGPGSGLLRPPIALQNPGFENGTLAPWTHVSGGAPTIEAPGRIGNVGCNLISTFAGDWVCDMQTGTTIRQRIDVTEWAAEIDPGTETIQIQWWFRDWDCFATNFDITRINFRWLDKDLALISSTTGANFGQTNGLWAQKSQINTIPTLTRFIEIDCFVGNHFNGATVDEFKVTTSFVDSSSFQNDDFNYSVLSAESGQNAGKGWEVKDFETQTKDFTLYLPAPFPWRVGDLVRVHIGCDRELTTCIRLKNSINYGGFMHVKGDDEFLSYPDSPV